MTLLVLNKATVARPAARCGDSAEAAGAEHLDRLSDSALVHRPLDCFEPGLSSEARPHSCTSPTANAGSRSPPSDSVRTRLQRHKQLL